jgi:excisionase family DNA binding protein
MAKVQVAYGHLSLTKHLQENVKLTTSYIAAYCQVSKSTVLAWIKNDELKAYSLPGGHYRIDKEDFMNFLKKWNIPVKGWPFEETEEK